MNNRLFGRVTPVPLTMKGGVLLATVTALVWLSPSIVTGASLKEDANGFVVMESENFDLNVTQDTGKWLFDSAPLAWSGAGSGAGYMKADGAGGTSMSTSPRLDFKVKFNVAGPKYIWVLASDMGNKELHLGLDGVVTTNSMNIGGFDGAFGSRNSGMWLWSGTNNAGSPLRWVNKSYLDVTSAASDRTVNVFIQGGGIYVDKVVLTTNINWAPSPFHDQYTLPANTPNGGAANIPSPSFVGSAFMSVAMTQPATGKSFVSNAFTVVALAAKAVTNGTYAVSKMEFFAKLLPSGVNTKIGEATAAPWMFNWTNPPIGEYQVTAKATDTGARTATSPAVTISVTAPPSYITPLVWSTNNFDSGLGSWTSVLDNHAMAPPNYTNGFNLDWVNSSFAGGSAGEFGGLVVRSLDLSPFVGEPLNRRVSMNDELYVRGRVYCRNYGPDAPNAPDEQRVSANADVFIGYFDSTVPGDPPRLGLKIREPNSTYPNPGNWRLWYGRDGGAGDTQDTGYNATETNSFPFELHWTPSGAGDGSGTMTGWVINSGNTFISVGYGASTVTFDTIGLFCPAQGDNMPNRLQTHYLDNMEYTVPASTKLDITLISSTKTVLSWSIPDHILQYADGSLPLTRTNAAWVDISTNSVTLSGGKYYYTNTIGALNRWFQLKHP